MADTIATISLRSRLVKIHESRRLRKAFDYLRESVGKMSKLDARSVKIDTKLGEYMMVNPSRRMSKLEVKITKEANGAKVFLAKPQAARKVSESLVKPAGTKSEKKVEAKATAKPAAQKKEKAAKPKTEEAK
ncbi:MAG: hypothetical protein KGH53_01090 [Candidatus Micrarchaeota archaeon]|nr:hypothetical protein [Candidatus Micrarchaeota archaeon]